MANWGWTAKYAIVIVVALLLGLALGNLALFKGAALGTPRLTAALLVQFTTHVAALALLWMVGSRAAAQMRESDERLGLVAMIVLAFVTLVITAAAYVVLSNFLTPFVTKGVREGVRWLFICGVVAAATWFMLALFEGAEDLIGAVRESMRSSRQA